MKKIHALAVAAILAVSAAFGLLAATRTAGLHSANASASSAAVAARAHRLDRVEASLRRALRDKPPALPPLLAPRAAPPAPQVVYKRPAPIIVVKHRPSSEAEHERESDD
jgi:type II secretory pathway pseudopilin PulG